jgi:hypothetical protein
MWWFLIPVLAGMAGLAALLFIGHQFGFFVWPAIGASLVLGLVAWQLYEADGAVVSVLRAVGLILASIIRETGCREPIIASAGYDEPSLVFLVGTSTRLTDGAGAAEFLRGGECRFGFIEARQERSFAQHAEANGLRYSLVTRIEGFNLGSPRPLAIAVYRSGGPE